MGQITTPPIATLRKMVLYRCAFSCARRCSGVRIVGVGCAIAWVGVRCGWAVVRLCAYEFDILRRIFGSVETCDEMWRAVECVVVEMW